MTGTPKQILKAHVREHHRRLAGLPTFERWTHRALMTAHRTDHHHYRTSHTHAGSNTGPGDRPPGWATGEDVVMR